MYTTRLSFHDRQHITRLLTQEGRVNSIFHQFIRTVSPEMRKWHDANNRSSVWVRNPGIEKTIDRQLLLLKSALESEIRNNQQIAWTSANLKNDELVERFISGMALSSVVKDGMFSRNLDGLRALQNRVDGGMSLSDRVWAITKQTKGNVEMFLESGLATGRSAESIGRDFRQMLKNPDARFRRVRNEKGELVPSQPMKKYEPGRGVYRSARMNALRVAATETNMGYRVSDCERWQGLDFVLGYEVKRSANGKPCKICDALVGEYPKDFVFSGFHPFCICFAVPILMNHDDFADFLLNDDVPQDKIVKDIPENAREWIDDMTKKGNTPLFVEKNAEWFNSQEAIAQGEQLKIDFTGSFQGKYVNISQKSAIDNLVSINENADHEESYTFLRDGSVYWKRSGAKRTAISFTQEERKLFKGADLIHNHPNTGMDTSLSKEDIQFFLGNDLKSIRAIAEDIMYIATRKAITRYDKAEFERVYKTESKKLEPIALRQGLTETEFYNRLNAIMAKKFGFTFTHHPLLR